MVNHSKRNMIVKSAAVMAVAAFYSPLSSVAIAEENAPASHIIEIQKFKFLPDNLSVKIGDTITWINHDVVPHTATALDKSWDTGKINKDEQKSLVVSEDMNTEYFCRFHKSMRATLKLIIAE